MNNRPTEHPGFTALPSWLIGEASPMEIATLLAIQHAPGQRISLGELARKTGISRSAICVALAAMKRKGWVAARATREDDGATGANHYELRIWPEGAHEESPVSTSRQEAGRWCHGTVPVDLLSSGIAHKGAVFVYVFLQGFHAPSISTLATLCGMAPKDVRRSLQWLEAEGWIQRIERPGDTSQFRVFFERIGAHQG